MWSRPPIETDGTPQCSSHCPETWRWSQFGVTKWPLCVSVCVTFTHYLFLSALPIMLPPSLPCTNPGRNKQVWWCVLVEKPDHVTCPWWRTWRLSEAQRQTQNALQINFPQRSHWAGGIAGRSPLQRLWLQIMSQAQDGSCSWCLLFIFVQWEEVETHHPSLFMPAVKTNKVKFGLTSYWKNQYWWNYWFQLW